MTHRPVAVVGTGRMGAAMVGRIVAAGHPVTVYNRTPERAQGLGATVAPTAREAVTGAEVVVVSLADDDAVRAAYHGPDGIIAGLATGAVVCDTSTIAPATVRELAAAVAGARCVPFGHSGLRQRGARRRAASSRSSPAATAMPWSGRARCWAASAAGSSTSAARAPGRP